MKEKAKSTTEGLVERFQRNLGVYKGPGYNETQVRREFIDPFFEALGWDVANRKGYAEQYKDVVHEDSVKVGVSLKAPDYSFRIGGQRKFFLEAKRPSVSVKDDTSPAYQLRRYAWSAKLPLSILTDFEELAIYDCRQKPAPKDKVSAGRIAYYTYDNYLDEFDNIYDVLSKEAVLMGSFDRYVLSSKKKRGTGEVDKEFLKEIESWRDSLARNLALRNTELSIHELNFAVQHTIDRIIFLRICEDRGIENYGRLQSLINGTNIYRRLLQLFDEADTRYNSGLFNFKSDTLSHTLTIDDRVLKSLIENLYYPNSPYEFSVLGADILGNVYEQFLGKVIRLTAGHQAKVEEKPEVKKAGGVYYTPRYIVEYIVKNTVGRQLTGQTPKKVSKLKILDPACGSGSFLIGAYQYLLDWHLKWYMDNNPEKHAKGKRPAIYSGKGNVWRLTTQEKKQILLNNIFGVDIDRQATEVTKLSLLLKVLEDENQETLGKTLSLFKERALPDLKNNIKCGNSLIGPDFYDQMELDLGDEEIRRINVFDWSDVERGFGEIMKAGGFDAVIGNPPYVRQEMIGEFKPYFQSRYSTYNGVADLYVYFIEKAVSLLKDGGQFSYIVANKWMRARYGGPLRAWMKEQAIEEITDFGDLPVFEKATTYPCILRISRRRARLCPKFHATKVKTLDFNDLNEYVDEESYEVSRATLDDNGWSLVSEAEEAILAKVKSAGVPLSEYVEGRIYRGVLTGLNAAFVIDRATKERLIAEDPKSAELIKPFLVGKDIKRYKTPSSERFLIFTRRGVDIKQYAGIEEYLAQFKARLMPKPKDWKGDQWKGRKPGAYQWYEIQDTVDYYRAFEKHKIIYPNICKRPEFTIDTEQWFTNQKCFIISLADKYLLGILNSSLTFFLFRKILPKLRGDFYEPSYVYFKDFPILTIDFDKPSEKALHDKIVTLVEKMLDLNKKLQKVKIVHEKEHLQRQIQIADNQIDGLVYKLYGLTEEEIKVVEES